MNQRFLITRPRDNAEAAVPDLQTQLEELIGEVWAQESFERTHPFTCATMREPVPGFGGDGSTRGLTA